LLVSRYFSSKRNGAKICQNADSFLSFYVDFSVAVTLQVVVAVLLDNFFKVEHIATDLIGGYLKTNHPDSWMLPFSTHDAL
jgi:hypothetical protein